MQTSGFFNSTVGADGSYDRQYTAEDFAEYFAAFVGNGVFQNKSNALLVTESDSLSMSVTVQPGQGWINGYWYKNSNALPLSVAISDGVLGRIDYVVLRLGFSERSIECVVKTGTPAASPVAPALQRDSDYYELALAQINVSAATINIRNSNIVDLRSDSTYCGFVQAAIQSIDTTYFGNQLNQFIARYISQADLDYEEFQSKVDSEYDEFRILFNGLLERLRNLVDDDDALGQLVVELSFKQNKPSEVRFTLSSSSWSYSSASGRYEYSFEDQYPSSDYDIDCDLDWDSVSENQAHEWFNLKVRGSYDSNKIVAWSGTKPSYDQPIVLYVTARN